MVSTLRSPTCLVGVLLCVTSSVLVPAAAASVVAPANALLPMPGQASDIDLKVLDDHLDALLEEENPESKSEDGQDGPLNVIVCPSTEPGQQRQQYADLSHFECKGFLGNGAFGSVVAVEKKKKEGKYAGKRYALKIQPLDSSGLVELHVGHTLSSKLASSDGGGGGDQTLPSSSGFVRFYPAFEKQKALYRKYVACGPPTADWLRSCGNDHKLLDADGNFLTVNAIQPDTQWVYLRMELAFGDLEEYFDSNFGGLHADEARTLSHDNLVNDEANEEDGGDAEEGDNSDSEMTLLDNAAVPRGRGTDVELSRAVSEMPKPIYLQGDGANERVWAFKEERARLCMFQLLFAEYLADREGVCGVFAQMDVQLANALTLDWQQPSTKVVCFWEKEQDQKQRVFCLDALSSPRVAFADYSISRCDKAWATSRPDPLSNDDGKRLVNELWKLAVRIWNGKIPSGVAESNACAKYSSSPAERCALVVDGGGMGSYFPISEAQEQWICKKMFMAHVNHEAVASGGSCSNTGAYNTQSQRDVHSMGWGGGGGGGGEVGGAMTARLIKSAYSDDYISKGPGMVVNELRASRANTASPVCLGTPHGTGIDDSEIEHYGFVHLEYLSKAKACQ